MAHSIDPVADEFIPRHYPYVRPAALLLLLLGEVLLFTIRFETPGQLGQGLWWGFVFYRAHLIFCSMLVVPVAIAALGGIRLLVRIRRAIEIQATNHEHWATWLVAHVASMVGFTWLSLAVCEGGAATSAHSGTWALAWVVSGFAVASTWMATWLPPTTWMALFRRTRKEVFMGFSVAFVALFLGNYTGQLWESMAGVTLAMVEAMLGLFTRNFSSDLATKIVILDGFKVQVGPLCSGLEGIGLILAFLSGYLWWFRNSMRWPQSLVLLPLGGAVIFLMNSVRIASLIMIGAWASPEVAFGAFHSQAGWLAFLGVSLGLVAATRRLSFFAAQPAGAEASTVGTNPSAAYLVPFLAVLATSMVTGTFASGFDRLYGLRALTGGLALWYFRRELVGWLSGWSWVGVLTGVVAFGLWVALEPTSTGSGRALALAVNQMPQGQAWAWIVLRVIGSVAIVPIVEELAFRGYLTRRLSSVDFQSIPIERLYWPTLLLTSAAFGLLHGRWLAGMLVGVLYGLVLCRRGKLGDAIVAHAVTNALIAATVLVTGDWTMWT